MQVNDLVVTGDARILGNLYTKDGNVSGGSGGSGSGDSGVTYKLSKSGSTITLTGSDGSTSSVTDANTDTNTTYSAGTGISLSGTTFSNSGVRSIATGSSNGTISVNTNGTSANVAVKGLGSAAYTASTAYAASSHTHNDLKPFVATYGSTKFSEIKAAYNAGKVVYMKDTLYNVKAYLTLISDESATFIAVVLTESNNASSDNPFGASGIWGHRFVVFNDDSWTRSDMVLSNNRGTAVHQPDTNYTTFMARGTSLNSSTTNPAVNGAIAWTYA